MGCCFSNQVSTHSVLDDATYENTQPFAHTFTSGKVVKVYDGDTLHLVAEVDGKLYRFKIRMFGYDSPEIRTKDLTEKKAGLLAKSSLESQVLNKVVHVYIHPEVDKYGRILATISLVPFTNGDKTTVNQWMIDNRHGYVYHGGTKQVYEDA